MTYTLITIHKGVILNQRVPQRGRFFGETWVQILSTKTRFRLGHGRFQRAAIPQSTSSSTLCNQAGMK